MDRKKTVIRIFARLFLSFAASGILYVGIETVFRLIRGHNQTNPLVIILGGTAYLICAGVNRIPLRRGLIWLKPLMGGVLITLWELVFGLFFNIYLGLRIWDYTGCPHEFMGQICAPFFLVWVFVAVIIMFIEFLLDNYILKNTVFCYSRLSLGNKNSRVKSDIRQNYLNGNQ